MSNFQQQDYVTLTKSHLFRKKTPEQVKELLQAITSFVKQYNKGDLVVSNYDQAHYLGIILEGKLDVQKIQANGKSTTLAQLGVAQLIGEAVLFPMKNLSFHHLRSRILPRPVYSEGRAGTSVYPR